MEIHPHPEGLKLLRVEAPEYDATFEVYGNRPVQAFGAVLGRELYCVLPARLHESVWLIR